VDVSGFGIANVECLISAMGIGMIGQIKMQVQDVVHQMQLEFLDISLCPFTRNKFTPGLQEVLDTDKIFKRMSQLNFHMQSPSSPPPRTSLPILQRLIGVYKLWHEYVPHFPKTSRYTLGGKIDTLFVETIEAIHTASYLSKAEKLPWIRRATTKLDGLKFFLQVAWELKALDNKKYVALSEPLAEIGRMLGGWTRQVESVQTKPNL